MGDRRETRADPDEIETTGGAVIGLAADLDAAIAAFSRTAPSVDGAFGKLGPSTDALEAYVTTTRKTIEALRHLQEAIELTGEGLRTTARNYRAADGGAGR